MLPNPNPSHLGFEDIVDGFLKGLEHGRKCLEKSPFKKGEEEVAVVVHFYLHVHMLTYIHMFIYREKHKSYNYTCILFIIHNTLVLIL